MVGSVVTGVWAVGYLLSYFNQHVKAPGEMTPIMLGVVAYLFAREIREKKTNGSNDG